MITLITAVPGSGKTLLAVGLIEKYLQENRQVFHNINGLKVDSFPNAHNLHDAPDDWRKTPHGSVVIYDECQQPHLYPATAERGKVLDERLTAMETHRHTGHDLIFITQAPTFVHHHIRKLVGCHIHLYRGGGSKTVAKYEWSHTCDNPNDRKEQERADFQLFSFNKAHYDLYKSATIHTHKFKIPKKLIILFMFIAALIIPIIFQFSTSQFMPWTAPQSKPSAEALAPARAATHTPPLSTLHDVPARRALAGCIDSVARGCSCWDSDLVPLDMPDAQCRALLLRPLPRFLDIAPRSKTTKTDFKII